MRVVVTGAGNPYGEAIVRRLVADKHAVRVFGVDAATARKLGDVQWHPGSLTTGGSIEPVLSERQALIHAACMDAPGPDRHAHAKHIEQGTLYTRYGAEREQVDHFVHVAPTAATGRFAESHQRAIKTVQGTRGLIHVAIVHASDPEQTARDVASALSGPALGKQPGRESDAVTV